MSITADELRSVRNYFVLGLYQECIKEAKNLSKSDPSFSELAQLYAVRAMIEDNPSKVTFPKKSSTALSALAELASYRTASKDLKEMVVDKVKGWLQSDITGSDPILQIVAAQIFFEEGDFKSSLHQVKDADKNLEKLAIQVMIFLKIDRIDLADKTLKNMQAIDDDDPITSLATAWVAAAQGGERASEAAFVVQELIEKFGPSVKTLNLLAACQMRLKNWNEASKFLKEARDLSSQAGKTFSSDTYYNSMVNLHQAHKSQELINKVQGDFEKHYSEHPMVLKRKEAEAIFDRNAKKYG